MDVEPPRPHQLSTCTPRDLRTATCPLHLQLAFFHSTDPTLLENIFTFAMASRLEKTIARQRER